MSETRIAAVVLNWNSAADTLECVASLQANNEPRLSVIVVDNGSTDSSWEELQQAATADTILIQSGANLGYAGGNNVGIRAALNNRADYIWILNNDTVVHPLCLTELLRAAEIHQARAGIFVPKILQKDGSRTTVFYAGGGYDWVRGQASHWRFGAQDDEHFEASCDVIFATGTSLFVRREVFEQIGLLDERYFLYWEDVQFSRRALHGGYKICFVPTARVWHRGMASSKQYGHRSSTPTYDYYTMRNRLWYIREEHRGWTWVSAYVWTMPLLLGEIARIFLQRENRHIVLRRETLRGNLWRKKFSAIMRGVFDGVLRRPRGVSGQVYGKE